MSFSECLQKIIFQLCNELITSEILSSMNPLFSKDSRKHFDESICVCLTKIFAELLYSNMFELTVKNVEKIYSKILRRQNQITDFNGWYFRDPELYLYTNKICKSEVETFLKKSISIDSLHPLSCDKFLVVYRDLSKTKKIGQLIDADHIYIHKGIPITRLEHRTTRVPLPRNAQFKVTAKIWDPILAQEKFINLSEILSIHQFSLHLDENPKRRYDKNIIWID